MQAAILDYNVGMHCKNYLKILPIFFPIDRPSEVIIRSHLIGSRSAPLSNDRLQAYMRPKTASLGRKLPPKQWKWKNIVKAIHDFFSGILFLFK